MIYSEQTSTQHQMQVSVGLSLQEMQLCHIESYDLSGMVIQVGADYFVIQLYKDDSYVRVRMEEGDYPKPIKSQTVWQGNLLS